MNEIGMTEIADALSTQARRVMPAELRGAAEQFSIGAQEFARRRQRRPAAGRVVGARLGGEPNTDLANVMVAMKANISFRPWCRCNKLVSAYQEAMNMQV